MSPTNSPPSSKTSSPFSVRTLRRTPSPTNMMSLMNLQQARRNSGNTANASDRSDHHHPSLLPVREGLRSLLGPYRTERRHLSNEDHVLAVIDDALALLDTRPALGAGRSGQRPSRAAGQRDRRHSMDNDSHHDEHLPSN